MVSLYDENGSSLPVFGIGSVRVDPWYELF